MIKVLTDCKCLVFQVDHECEEVYKLPQEKNYNKIEYCTKIKGWKLLVNKDVSVHAAALGRYFIFNCIHLIFK